jgi:hypothetical protein
MPLKVYMIVNFRVRKISQGTRKLAQTLTLILKKIHIRDVWFVPVGRKSNLT